MKTITFDNMETARELFGRHNYNLARISDAVGVQINARGSTLNINGSDEGVVLAEKILIQLYGLIEEKISINFRDIDAAAKALRVDTSCRLKDIFLDKVFVTAKNKPVTPKNPAQKRYVDAIRQNDIVFSIGPAGTGKTYLAVAMAVAAFTRGEVKRIVLTRPAVEAGEALGFLPGDLAEKINPYLRPLYDALYDMLTFEKTRELIEKGTIEVAPLAFMRGRTLNNSFIILDEAQNTSKEQMKMFLTRIGFGSRAVITGDITQTDLPAGRQSGLVQAKNILQNIKGINFSFLSSEDVVRHRLVSEIIKAYESKLTGKAKQQRNIT